MNFAKFPRAPSADVLFFPLFQERFPIMHFFSVGFFKGTSTDNLKKCFEKYCSCDQACQVSALKSTP